MEMKKLLMQNNRMVMKLLATAVLLLVTFLIVIPAGNRIEERFSSLGIAPGDDITEMMHSIQKETGPALKPDPGLRYNLYTNITLRDMRLLIDSIQLSLTTGFKFNISELDEEQRAGFTVKNFLIKGKASFLGIAGFILAIEEYPMFMRFKTGTIRYYGVLEGSVSFVDYELVISVPVQPAGFFLPPFTVQQDSLFEQIDIFLPFIESVAGVSEPGAVNLDDYELRAVKNGEAEFHHIRFKERIFLRAGDEIKGGIIKEVTKESVKVLYLNRNEVSLVELKIPD